MITSSSIKDNQDFFEKLVFFGNNCSQGQTKKPPGCDFTDGRLDDLAAAF